MTCRTTCAPRPPLAGWPGRRGGLRSAAAALRRAGGSCCIGALVCAAAAPAHAGRIEVRLAAIDPRSADQVVLFLLEPEGKKFLPISVSPAQAESIYRGRSGVRPPRPLTHELMVSVLEALGARLSRVDITDLRNDTYYADLTLDSGGRTVHVDARPSDAIALALRVNAPIFAEEELLVPLEGRPHPSVEAHPVLSSLGLQLQDLTDDLARFFAVPGGTGVLVAEASASGPASLSGVERGDVIRRIGGERVETVSEALAALAAAQKRGKPVEISLVRDGRERSVRLTW